MGKVEKKNDTLLSLFAEFIERQRPLVGIDITRSTFNKYDLTYRRLEEFLSTKQKKEIFRCARSTTISFATFTPF